MGNNGDGVSALLLSPRPIETEFSPRQRSAGGVSIQVADNLPPVLARCRPAEAREVVNSRPVGHSLGSVERVHGQGQHE
jgi:hypothetical protein